MNRPLPMYCSSTAAYCAPTREPAVPMDVVGPDVYMRPFNSTATILFPSAEEATDRHSLLLSRGVQVTPESADVYICPRSTTATSRVLSAEEATEVHPLMLSRGVQLTPESVEV